MSDAQAAGAIYDLGYQRYSGARLSRWYSLRILAAYSFRSAFGVGRGEKAKMMPVLVAALVFLPALVQVGVASSVGMVNLIHYADYFEFTGFLLALFAAGQAPELIVADKQQGVLSLYLSRPMRSTDYAWAKLAALFGAMLVLTLGPQVMLLLGHVFIAKDPWPEFAHEWTKVFPMLAGSILVSLFIAAIGLALASMASRRGYATAAVISFFLFTAALSTVVQALGFGGIERYAVLGNPTLLISGLVKWLFEVQAVRGTAVGKAALAGPYYLWTLLAVTALAITIFIRSYRRGDV